MGPVPVLRRLRICDAAWNGLVCSQGTSSLRWSLASVSLRDTHPCAECLGAALSPLSAGPFLQLNAAGFGSLPPRSLHIGLLGNSSLQQTTRKWTGTKISSGHQLLPVCKPRDLIQPSLSSGLLSFCNESWPEPKLLTSIGWQEKLEKGAQSLPWV